MKRFLLLITTFCLLLSHSVAQSHFVTLFNDSPQKKTIVSASERNLNALLVQIDKAYQNNTKQVSFDGVKITDYAKTIINDALWSNIHFQLDKKHIEDQYHLWIFSKTMEVRNIPFKLEEGRTNRDYQEAIIEFDTNGVIQSFAFQNEQTLFETLESGNKTADVKNQLIIWKWVERLRTAYNEKDTVFLNAIYSDDAVIISGSVYTVKRRDSHIRDFAVKYNKQTKDQYLTKLKRMMKPADYKLEIKFSAIENPSVNNDNIHYSKFITSREGENSYYYGVRVRQEWIASRNGQRGYSDQGFLFLLWEFPKDNSSDPIIHVRTWQPEIVGFDDIFSITDFVDYLK